MPRAALPANSAAVLSAQARPRQTKRIDCPRKSPRRLR